MAKPPSRDEAPTPAPPKPVTPKPKPLAGRPAATKAQMAAQKRADKTVVKRMRKR